MSCLVYAEDDGLFLLASWVFPDIVGLSLGRLIRHHFKNRGYM